ncbi:retrotransposon protein, putative, ty1-copia subclass [Tanacetum coccineum]
MHCVGRQGELAKPQANKKGKGIGKANKNKHVCGLSTKLSKTASREGNNLKKDQACPLLHVGWSLEEEYWSSLLEEFATNKNKKAEHGGCTFSNYLLVGKLAKAAVEAIGVFNLVLPSGLVLSLNNCYYAHSIVRGVVSFLLLLDLDLLYTVTSNGISVSLNGIFYFSAISVNGVFEIDMNDNVSKYNNNSIFSINKKRKLDLNSSYLWHCRLAHIGKTRMQKLQREGLLESINDGSYDKCESCISGKMTKKPFNNNIERATVLILYVMVLFTCLNINMSQEFKDYLGKNGIVQHLTSPYTPQQNGVSERRNRTLLDMIWFPTKKVDRTPYGNMDGKTSSNAKVVRSKWLFKKKTDMDSEVHTYKAIRILIAIALKPMGLTTRKHEDIYMEQPEGYVNPKYPNRDLGEAAYILGIKIYRDRSKRLIGLSQSAYIDKILKKFNMHNSKKGSIMYVVRCTRPDVAFAQNLVSRYQQNPGKLHWVAVKHILKYLRNTRDIVFVYMEGNQIQNLMLQGSVMRPGNEQEADNDCDVCNTVNSMAALEAAMEAIWIRKFIRDLGVMPSIKKPINMYCDNSAAIIFANDSGVMKGARHFLRRYHYVREQVESGEIKILKVHTDDNLADPFTKALPRGNVTDHANGIGLQLASSFMHTCD